jgi:hypothetical protein
MSYGHSEIYQSVRENANDDDSLNSTASDKEGSVEDPECSSSDEEEENESEIFKNRQAEEDETYYRFVRSLFCEDDIVSATNSITDEDDEDYKPELNEIEDDDDDEEDDKDVKVKPQELKELVSECWQAILGESPLLPMNTSTEGNTEAEGMIESSTICKSLKRDHETVNDERETTCCAYDDSSVADSANNLNGVDFIAGVDLASIDSTRGISRVMSQAPVSSDVAAPLNNSLLQLDNISQSSDGCGGGGGTTRLTAAGQSSISSVIRQVFSGEKPSEVSSIPII